MLLASILVVSNFLPITNIKAAEESQDKVVKVVDTVPVMFTVPPRTESVKFWAENPEDSTDKIDIKTGWSSNKIPGNYKVHGEILMEPGRVIVSSGNKVINSHLLQKENIEELSKTTGGGDKIQLKYTMTPIPLADLSSLFGVQWEIVPLNFVGFNLNGGAWTDEKDSDLVSSNQNPDHKLLYITPFQTVYKPTDPVKEGYKFLGWVGTSKLDAEINKFGSVKEFTEGNYYQFDEVDEIGHLGYTRGTLVKLTALWAKEPTLEVGDKEILVYENFEPKDLLKKATDSNGKDLSDKVEISGEYNTEEPGEYEITFIVTDEHGGKSTKTAKLVVKPRKEIKETKEIPFETEYVYDPELKSGESVIDEEGQKGELTITKTFDKDKMDYVSEEEVTKKPVNRVIRIGGKSEGTHEYINKIPFEVEVRVNKELLKGEYNILQKGEEGEEKFTAKIVNSKVVETSEPERTKEPKPEIIEIGNKDFTGKVEHVEKFDIPFEVEVRYNDEIPAGEHKVLQKGEKGSYEVLYSQDIKNGEPQGELSKTEQNRVEPKNHIIEIGNKPFETEIVDKVTRELNFSTEIVYDENLEVGTQVVDEDGELGEEEVTIINKVVNGEVTKTEESKVVKEPKNRVVRIGVKPTTKTVEIPYETEYKHNPELKVGETNVIQEGKTGKVEHVITFNQVTGKIEVTENKVDSVKKIVEYGSKTEGEFKFKNDIPFEVEIIKDPDMEVGQEEVVQEGELGEEETTVIIENSKEVSRDTELIKEPVKRIVKIGTKCKACEPQKPCEPEKPEQPDEPTEPSEPETPDVTDPVEPTEPSDKTPEQPEEPSKPSEEKPGEPTKPSKPSEATEPSKERLSEPQGTTQKVKPSDTKVTAKAEKNLKPVVDTGVGVFGIASGLSLVTAAVVAEFIRRKRK